MSISKATRIKVYEKYGGHCAYCGCELAYKDMQVDHFVPLHGYFQNGSDEIRNLMPSCRTCNHYKRANPLELWRIFIQEIPLKLRETNYIYKVGLKYGLIVEQEHPVEFYYERVERELAESKKESE